jgi:hypothetical protein
MSKFYTYGAWEETFKPIKNNLRSYDSITFETYGDEVEFVKQQDPKHIWTEVDGDSGTYIVAGWHFVNRIQYYITENPWEDEYTEVPTWCYRNCDCTDDEDFLDEGYNPDCPDCDEGMIDIDVDTVEDLKQIYGEDNADIVA